MSDAPPPPADATPPIPPEKPASEPAQSPAPTPAPPAKKPREHALRHRLWIITLMVLLVAAVVRLSLGLLLPIVANHVAGEYGLKCEYDRLTLSLLGGTAYVWDMKLGPKEGGDAIVRADYLQGYISPLNLLRGRLVVWRAEADGVDVIAERNADGSIPLLKRFLAQTSASAAASTPSSSAPAAAKPWNLQAPLRVDAVRLSHVNIHFRDLSVSPAFETQVQATVRLSDIGSAQEPARVEVELGADPVLDSLRISGVVHNTATTIDAELHLLLRGLHPKPAAAYLLPIGLRPIAEDVSVRGDMQVKVQANATSPDVSATLTINGISATADGQQWASLKTVSLDASLANGRALKLGQLLVADGEATVARSPDGHVRCGGFEVVSAVKAAVPQAQGEDTPAIAMAANPFAFLTPPAINAELKEIRLANLRLSLVDQSFVPAITASAKLDALSVKNIVLDPSRATSPVAIDGAMSVPGIARSIAIKGQATVVPANKKLSLSLRVDGIRPDAAKPYLDRLGIDSQLVDGSLTGQLDADANVESDGELSADAYVTNVVLSDRGQPLATINKLTVGGKVREMQVFRTGKGILAGGPMYFLRIAGADGPEMTVGRQADGGISACGFRLRPHAPGAELVKAQTPAKSGSALDRLPDMLASLDAIALPYIQVQFAMWNARVRFVDEMGVLDKPVDCTFDAQLRNAQYQQHAANAMEAGRFEVHASLPGIADSITADGSLQRVPGGGGVRATVSARGITGKAIAPYLQQLGITPTIRDGQFDSEVGFTVASGGFRGDGLYLTLNVQKAALREGDRTMLAGVNAVDIGPVILQPAGITVPQLHVIGPMIAVQRNRDGSFTACGVRVALPADSRSAGAGETNAPLALHLPKLPIGVKIDSLVLQYADLDWSDEASLPPIKTHAMASVTLNGIDLSPGAAPAHLHASATIVGAIEQATADGAVHLAPDAPSVKLTVDAKGIRAGPLLAYLPADMSSTLRQGHFSAGIELAAKNNPAGGISGRIAVRDLSFIDETPATDWAHVGQFTIDARRIDPAGGVIAIDTVSSADVSAMVRRLPSGAIEAGGLRFESSSPTANPRAGASSKDAVAIAPESQRTVNVAALVEAARRPLPLVTIDRLDLQLRRFTVEGAIDPNGAPLALSNVRLRAPGRLALGGPNAAGRGPVQLLTDGGLDPIAQSFSLNLSAWPFVAEPAIKMDVSARGISGQGIIDVMPQLGAIMQGKELTEGTLTTQLSASANYGRRGPRDFDLSRGFVATFLVSPLQYRDKPDGPVVAGFQALHGEGISVKPLTGEVRAKLIEMTTPIGRFYRDAAGLHALGLVIPLKSEKSPSPTDAKNVRIEGSPTPAPAIRKGPPIRPAGEIRLDRFTISGIDMLYEDRTTTPMTEIPLKTLDVEVNDVSNQMPWTGQQARFNVLCTSDKVWLPARPGEVSTATTRTAGGEYLEQRDLFSEITATGKIGIRYQPDGTPALDGWAKTAVDGFELLGVRGLADQFKVKIGGGVFDDTNDIKFQPGGPILTNNRFVVTNLQLGEPANGPIQSWLKIPMPINIGIGFITDADGSITLNLAVPIKNSNVQLSDLTLPLGGAIGGVIITAAASAPIKIVDIFGGGPKAGTNAPQIVRVPFVAGYADLLDPGERAVVAQVAKQMKDDPNLQVQISHDLSPADVARAAVRANPTPQQCLVLGDRLRRQKEQLLARRADLAAEARGEIPSQSPAAPATLAQLRDTDRDLAGIESSLDQLYDLLRPGASAQSSRRTRQASLELARARMETIRNAIVGGDPALLDRTHMTVAQSTVAAGMPTDSDTGGSVVLTLVFKRH